MKLILFTHYSLFKTASMPRFARMIADGMRERGHEVEEWPCPVILGNKVKHPFLAKWLGYIDQFLLFPQLVRKRLKSEPQDTLFVITDQALGPWVPLIADRQHVIHCHDFLAQRSALGEFPENPTGRTGRLYQAYIRRGYRKGRNFISVSKKTQEDLHRFLTTKPAMSEVVYNGLNYPFCPLSVDEAMSRLEGIPALQEIFSHVGGQESEVRGQGSAVAAQRSEAGGQGDERQVTNNEQPSTNNCGTAAHPSTSKSLPRFILHVGIDVWYKNRAGVIEVYSRYAEQVSEPLPLVIVGVGEQIGREFVPGKGRMIQVEGIPSEVLNALYSCAAVLLFPSLEEGFGWPIAEAMACGCPVITTDKPPMSEVAGDVGIYLRRKIAQNDQCWVDEGAATLRRVIETSSGELQMIKKNGIKRAREFRADAALDRYEENYLQIQCAG